MDDDGRPRLVLVPKEPEPDRIIGKWRLHRPEFGRPLHARRPDLGHGCPEVDLFISDAGYFDMQASERQLWGLLVPGAVIRELLADAVARGAKLDVADDEDVADDDDDDE